MSDTLTNADVEEIVANKPKLTALEWRDVNRLARALLEDRAVTAEIVGRYRWQCLEHRPLRHPRCPWCQTDARVEEAAERIRGWEEK